MPKQPKHLVIIAGEESGDAHAAELIKQLKAKHPDLKISGIGGKHMDNAGAELLFNLAQYGVTGFTEVIKHLSIIRKAFQGIKQHLQQTKPDLLLLIDYPGFNLRLAKYAKKVLGIKIIYYISPQIWAWKANRIHLIKQCVDRMAVIFPFEKTIYEKAQVPVSFVGHPLVEKVSSKMDGLSYRNDFNLPQQSKIIALLPGSRMNEIDRHMPVLRETVRLLHQNDPNLHFLIPVAGSISNQVIDSYFTGLNLPLSIIEGKALECMAAADFVIVASGTASLECALLEKPMCIIYKCSFITYQLARKLIKIKYLGLCNILANRMLVPEFLQKDCNAVEIAQFVINFNKNNNQPQKMKHQLATIKELLSSKNQDYSILQLIENEMPEINA